MCVCYSLRQYLAQCHGTHQHAVLGAVPRDSPVRSTWRSDTGLTSKQYLAQYQGSPGFRGQLAEIQAFGSGSSFLQAAFGSVRLD